MTKRTCHWSRCTRIIEVDTSIEGKQSLFSVAGWCEIHEEAYRIYHKLEQKYAKDNHIDWPIGSLSYKKHKKALNQLHELAGHRAEAKK